MVFIHPVILRDNVMTHLYTNSKYNQIRSLQQVQDEDGVNLLPSKKHPVLPPMEEFSSIPAVAPLEPAGSTLTTE